MLLLLLGSNAAAVDSPTTPRMAEGFYRRKQLKAAVRSSVVPSVELTKRIATSEISETSGAIPSSAGYHASAQDRSAQIDAEIRTLLHASMERDDEEALFTILTALEY